MARTVKDANLISRNAREKLKPRHEPYWRALDKGRHLGYRKGETGGAWIARWRHPKGFYKKKVIGKANDKADADGTEILDYGAAQSKARAVFAEWAEDAAGNKAKPYTVREAVKDYLEDYEGRGGKALRSLRYSIDAHILPAFGDKQVFELTDQEIRKWHLALARAPARLRTGRLKKQTHRCAAATPDHKRQRRATANKILAMLKAACNHAFNAGKAKNDAAWRSVKPFKKVDSPRIRYLTEAEATRLANVCDPDFRRLVKGALLTGARYGELTAMCCADLNSEVGTIHVRPGKSDTARDVTLTTEAQEFFQQLTAGRAGDELVFLREDGTAWGKGHQRRRLEDACKKAKIKPAVSFHILRHCPGSWLAMKGVPIRVIAHHLGHSDTRICERHYAHLSPDYVKDTIRDNLPDLGFVDETNVARMTSKK